MFGFQCCLQQGRRYAPAHVGGRVKGHHQHLPRGHEADSVALDLEVTPGSGSAPWVRLCPLPRVQQVYGLAPGVLLQPHHQGATASQQPQL